MIDKIFVKYTSLFILDAPFFVHLVDVLRKQYVHAHECAPNF